MNLYLIAESKFSFHWDRESFQMIVVSPEKRKIKKQRGRSSTKERAIAALKKAAMEGTLRDILWYEITMKDTEEHGPETIDETYDIQFDNSDIEEAVEEDEKEGEDESDNHSSGSDKIDEKGRAAGNTSFVSTSSLVAGISPEKPNFLKKSGSKGSSLREKIGRQNSRSSRNLHIDEANRNESMKELSKSGSPIVPRMRTYTQIMHKLKTASRSVAISSFDEESEQLGDSTAEEASDQDATINVSPNSGSIACFSFFLIA